MARRESYTKVEKRNEVRANHVKGMGDIVFKGFQCLNSECQQFLFTRMDNVSQDFEIRCPTCGYVLRTGDESRFYDYDLRDLRDNSVIRQGTFTILHDDYLAEAQEYKYCIICNTLKPLTAFDVHNSRKSQRQGECRLCKKVYNDLKNDTRLSDQHREAAQKRRLYLDLAGDQKVNSQTIFSRFAFKCFKCGKDLSQVTDPRDRPLDHTLPAYYLWPLTTENATLLCREHNGEKSGKWPSKYYTAEEQKRLSLITGIDFDLLSSPIPKYNPDALDRLKQSAHVDALLVKYGAYMPEIIKLRNRILRTESFDFFTASKLISAVWVQQADNEYKRGIAHKGITEEPDTDAL